MLVESGRRATRIECQARGAVVAGYARWEWAFASALCIGAAGVGCVPVDSLTGDGSTPLPEEVLGAMPDRPPAADVFSDLDPNDNFDQAQPVSFEETMKIDGSIAAGSALQDRDVYDLGPAAAGDRILGDLTIAYGADVVLGLLDDRFRLLAYIDLSSASTGPRQIDAVLREDAQRLYAVVATRSDSSSRRDYRVSLAVQRGLGVAQERPQTLVLNFSGASNVRIGSRSAVDVPPFDAAALSVRFAGQTPALIDAVLRKVRADFAGLNVSVHLADDPDLPAGERSVIYYGTYDARLLGLADNIDPYNSDIEQSAILYTDTFALFDVLLPSLEAMAQALANTTSHEAGHLLGLRHTADPTDLMDTTATARQMLLDQDFSLAALNASVISLGNQDAPSLLTWAVGGVLEPPASGKRIVRYRAFAAAQAADDFYIPRDRLMDCGGTGCEHPEPAGVP